MLLLKSRESFAVRFGNAVLGRGESNFPFKISIFQLSRNTCCQGFQVIMIRSVVPSFRYRLQLVGGWVRFLANKHYWYSKTAQGKAEQTVPSSFGAT